MDDPQNLPKTQTDQSTPQPPPAPVAPKLKEQAPVSADQAVSAVKESMKMPEANEIAKEEGDEYWENYAQEIELEKEIAELGVQKVESGEVPIPEEVARQMGIKPTVTAETPIPSPQGFSVRGVSLSDDQIAAGLTKPTSSGFRWLVEWFIYQLLKAHFLIKKVGSRITRVNKNK